MAWSKVDDKLFAHPKVLAAGIAAMGLWVMAQSYSSCYGTDGKLPMATIALLCSNSGLPYGIEPLLLADKLVEVGLWERTEEGYQFHDWAEYNPTKSRQVAEKTSVRLSRSEAGKLGAAKRWAAKADGNDSKNGKMAMALANGNDSPVPVPVPLSDPKSVCSEGATVLPSPEATPEPQTEEHTHTQETPPREEESKPEPAQEIVLGGKVSTILERYSGGVLTKLDLTHGQLYQLGMVARDLKENHGVDHTGWRALADWIAPSGPGFKARRDNLKPSWSLLLSKDGAFMRQCLKDALDWSKNAGGYRAR